MANTLTLRRHIETATTDDTVMAEASVARLPDYYVLSGWLPRSIEGTYAHHSLGRTLVCEDAATVLTLCTQWGLADHAHEMRISRGDAIATLKEWLLTSRAGRGILGHPWSDGPLADARAR